MTTTTCIRKSIAFVVFQLIILTSHAQTIKDIDQLKTEYQSCLDKGEDMLGCSDVFYSQIDSLLNVRYKKLRSICDSIQKENLKDEQLEWLSKRNKQFIKNKKRTNIEAKEEDYEGGQIEFMILIDTNANYIKQRVIELINKTPSEYSANTYKVNFTGLYKLDNKTEIINGDTYGHFGDIAVKSISKNKIAIRLFICKGAPSYNSGVLTDTLLIIDNKAIFKTEYDTSCKIIFTFYKRGIFIEQFADNPNNACGFGHAVDAYGFYKKKSSKIPTIKELTDE